MIPEVNINTKENLSSILINPINIDTIDNNNPLIMKHEFERLPSNVTPSHYELVLEPDLEKFVFKGQTTTNIQVLKKSNIELSYQIVRLTDKNILNPQESYCVRND